jgi:rare lipoprotein A
MQNLKLTILLLPAVILFGCSGSDEDRYAINQDVPPDSPIALSHIEDATPRYEPYSLGGNKNYTVRGKSYSIIKDPTGFKEKGKASWYGKKFHGHLTSNGETYDMYSMSAAHKNLPIPSYVRVTNVDNGKTTVVRVNDRGPFHPGRIIDLSYAAATKLGIVKTGVANVEIEHIAMAPKNGQPAAKSTQSQYIIQVASLSNVKNSELLAKKLSNEYSQPSFVQSNAQLHRIFIGPVSSADDAQKTLEQLKKNGYPSAFLKKYSAK